MVRNNPNLTCISVDSVNWSNLWWTHIDPQHYFSDSCSPTSINEQTKKKKLLKITDLLSRQTGRKKNQPLFYIYDDGTVEKKITID